MKRFVLYPTFLTTVFWLVSCQEKEVEQPAGCLMTQYNSVLLQYSSGNRQLQSLTSPEGNYSFVYDNQGKLTTIQAAHLSASFPVKTDAAENIVEALDYAFKYDTQNRLIEFGHKNGSIDTYHRFEYDAEGNLAKVFAKGQAPFSFDGPPEIVEILSQSNFLYDANRSPWQGDKVRQWLVATSLLVPFEQVDRLSAYSRHNVTGYSIYYAEDQRNPRFTSSVVYTYSESSFPVRYSVTGNAGAYSCAYGYQCGNRTAGD